jgi:hypothetical protein
MISWVAIDRMVEERRATDAEYRRLTDGRPLRSSALGLTDTELIARLHAHGITLDRPRLEQLSEGALSAEEIATTLLDRSPAPDASQGSDEDWVWICVDSLWRRWFPETPSFERLDDGMQAGYHLLEGRQTAPACQKWLEAWNDVLRLMDKAGLRSIAGFDDRFRGTQCLFNWIGDLEMELWNAGMKDRQYLVARVAVCEEALRRFSAEDRDLTENLRLALADSIYELGETARAESLYRGWLDEDPRWGWGWIGWSDCIRNPRVASRDPQKAERLLLEGLSVPEVEQRRELVERLAFRYEEEGRHAEARELRRQARSKPRATETSTVERPDDRTLRLKRTITFDGEGLPLSEMPDLAAHPGEDFPLLSSGQAKTGRNEPCPCGSGKKFKKCCGARPGTSNRPS